MSHRKFLAPHRALALIAVAGLGVSGCTMQQTSGLRESGQSRLMDDTFAGQKACDPDDHTRPFIIEWDATDMSSFESLAANDIVLVKYEGCKLRVLDECRNDSIRGSQGAYKPPEWTSGSLETLDIHNEGELYAKLPLGQATLGGRVQGGERFHMEYYVAGTVYATREAVYRDDLKSNPGCDPATHFVYGYNLGAFALGSANNLDAEVGASLYGFGGGGSRSSGRTAEKKGGDLAACQSEAATEVMGCKAPIRLNLRAVRDGANPDVEAMSAPENDATLNAAGVVNAKMEMSEEAGARYDAAQQKLVARDGKGCLAELDAHDKADPNHKSTDPKSGFATMRSQCVMLAGQCDAGKALLRKSLEATATVPLAPEQTANYIDAMAGMYCQGDSMSERDQLLKALADLRQGASSTKDVAYCDDAWARAKKLAPKVEPRDDDDHQIISMAYGIWNDAPSCYARAGDCKKAYKAYLEAMPQQTKEGMASIKDDAVREEQYRRSFESSVKKCKDK
ncbi:MAG: hypothetical protein R6X02_01580 [Enhygromyxa sp.]